MRVWGRRRVSYGGGSPGGRDKGRTVAPKEGILMFTIIEIILTVVAWRKGWRGRALLPLAGVLGVSTLLGLAVGAAGGSLESLIPVGILLELASLGALIFLVKRPPQTVPVAALATDTTPVVARGGEHA